MTDRELLTLAARPFGIEVIGGIAGDDGVLLFNGNIWNPLTDDGDALRLAVKLRIDCLMHGCTESLPYAIALLPTDKYPQADWVTYHEEAEEDDPYAAIRRAIVRAAAEIGKEMT